MSFLDPQRTLEIWQVDVFTDKAFCGNPAAVVFGADNLSEELMQAIARETNLSETVFIQSPRQGGDFFARTFTVQREIPFAVHPALAAAHAHDEAQRQSGAGGADVLRQECAAGIIEISRDSGGWFARVPDPEFMESDITCAQLAPMLGLSVKDMVGNGVLPIVSTGPRWLMAEVASSADLRRIVPDHSRIAAITAPSPAVGVMVFARTPGGPGFAEIRTFAPAEGIFEDPVCGSCAGSLAAYLRRDIPDFAERQNVILAQGHSKRRPGRMLVRYRPEGLFVGGRSVTAMRGRLLREEMTCPA